MKKYLLMLSALIAVSGLYAAKLDDVMSKVIAGQAAIYDGAFENQHQNAVRTWDMVFKEAKTFVEDNSKDLIGRKDSAIINSMNSLVSINNDFINTLTLIKNTLPKAPISQLLPVANKARTAYDTIFKAKFTLGGKNDAKKVLMHLARFFEDASKKLYNNLLIKNQSGPQSETIPAAPSKDFNTPPSDLPPVFPGR
jgi:hypothetical protein